MVDVKKEIQRSENLFDKLFAKESKGSVSKDKDVFDVLCEDENEIDIVGLFKQ
jgi:hypothetical protein